MRECYYNMLLRSCQCIRFKRVVGIVMKLREKPTRRFVRGLHDNNNNNRNTVQHHRRGREPFFRRRIPCDLLVDRTIITGARNRKRISVLISVAKLRLSHCS